MAKKKQMDALTIFALGFLSSLLAAFVALKLTGVRG